MQTEDSVAPGRALRARDETRRKMKALIPQTRAPSGYNPASRLWDLTKETSFLTNNVQIVFEVADGIPVAPFRKLVDKALTETYFRPTAAEVYRHREFEHKCAKRHAGIEYVPFSEHLLGLYKIWICPAGWRLLVEQQVQEGPAFSRPRLLPRPFPKLGQATAFNATLFPAETHQPTETTLTYKKLDEATKEPRKKQQGAVMNNVSATELAIMIWPPNPDGKHEEQAEWLHRSAFSFGGLSNTAGVQSSQHPGNLIFGTYEANSLMIRAESTVKHYTKLQYERLLALPVAGDPARIDVEDKDETKAKGKGKRDRRRVKGATKKKKETKLPLEEKKARKETTTVSTDVRFGNREEGYEAAGIQQLRCNPLLANIDIHPPQVRDEAQDEGDGRGEISEEDHDVDEEMDEEMGAADEDEDENADMPALVQDPVPGIGIRAQLDMTMNHVLSDNEGAENINDGPGLNVLDGNAGEDHGENAVDNRIEEEQPTAVADRRQHRKNKFPWLAQQLTYTVRIDADHTGRKLNRQLVIEPFARDVPTRFELALDKLVERYAYGSGSTLMRDLRRERYPPKPPSTPGLSSGPVSMPPSSSPSSGSNPSPKPDPIRHRSRSVDHGPVGLGTPGRQETGKVWVGASKPRQGM